MQITNHNATRPKILATSIYALKPYVWGGGGVYNPFGKATGLV